MKQRAAVAGRPIGFGLVVALAVLAFGPGCGRKSRPQPPPQIIPARTTDLLIQQRGAELILSFAYPQATISGLALGELQAVEFWELVRELPEVGGTAAVAEPDEEADDGMEGEEGEPTEEPASDDDAAATARDEDDEDDEDDEETADEDERSPLLDAPIAPRRPEDLVVVDPQEFAAAARIRLTIQGPELDAAVSGDKIVGRFPLRAAADTAERQAHIFAVKTISSKGLGSAYSNTVVLVRREPPPPPADFDVEPGGDGVEVSWTAAEEDGEMRGYHVYRRDAQVRNYGSPLRRIAVEEETFEDRTAAFGNRYIYALTGIIENQPLVETALSAEREVDYEDRFAPPAPRNLVLLAESGRVRVLWDASDDDDVAGYFIARQEEGGEWVELVEEPVRELEHRDATVRSGGVYRYRVSAIDQLGNRGAASISKDVRVP